MENVYLAHYGIRGQRWGVRRFENEDGTLTPAGIARYLDLKGSTNRSVRSDIHALAQRVSGNRKSEGVGLWRGTPQPRTAGQRTKFTFRRSRVFKEQPTKTSGGRGSGKSSKGSKGRKGSTKAEKEKADVWYHRKSDANFSEIAKSPGTMNDGFNFTSYIMRRIRSRTRLVTRSSLNMR